VVVVQTDFLNGIHPSTIICPITSNVKSGADILRVHLKKGEGGLNNASDILVDQLRAIDKRRLIKKLGSLSKQSKTKLIENIAVVLDIP